MKKNQGNDMSSKQGQWSSYLTFILATSGAAVGLGNIWKFPYIAGENGGGAFVLIYLVCITVIGLPLMMAEVMLGRSAGLDPQMTMKALAQRYKASKYWSWLGAMMVLAGFLILSYYSVIAGWALSYVFKAAAGNFTNGTAAHIDGLFATFINSPYELAFWHTVIMTATIGVVAMGVEKGLEKSVTYLLPTMVVLLLFVVGFSINTGYFGKGLSFLFAPDFSKITAHGVLVAVGHSFFTLSLATGSIMMYGAYLPRHISIAKTSFYIALADTGIALLAGLAIFPIVFSNGLEPGAGPGLIFKTLPLAFGHMASGSLFGMIFFVMLVFAAFTSAISLLEPTVAWLVDRYDFSRSRASFLAGFCIWLLGFPTVFSFNIWQHVKILGLDFFAFLDALTANFMLPIGGMLTAIFAAWIMKDAAKELEINKDELGYKLWHICLGYVTPVAIAIVFLNAIGVFK